MALKKDVQHIITNVLYVVYMDIDGVFPFRMGFFTIFLARPQKIGGNGTSESSILDVDVEKRCRCQGGMAPFVAQNMELIQARPSASGSTKVFFTALNC